jgi:hypothetical protein
MSRRGVRPFAAVLAMVAGLSVSATASATAAGSAGSSKPTACQVLERAEIRRVVDDTVTRARRKQHTPKSATICNWDVGGRNSGAIVSVWVQRGRPAREGYDVSERVFGLGAEALPELGVTAFYSSEAGAAYVLRGSEFLYVQRLDQSGAVDEAELREQTVELTQLAFERL